MMHQLDVLKRINGPALSPTILHREALVVKLNKILAGPSSANGSKVAHYKLVVLCAPAGYGKTTLLADFAQHTSLPCCWYFLDRTDVDKTRFLTAFILSIRHQFPDFGRVLDPLLSSAIAADVDPLSHTPHFEAVIDALVAAITAEIPERFALFLCNYHEVNTSQAVNDLVNQLLQKLPSQCVLVIESRAIPDLDFASLFAHDEIEGFDSTFLRFTTTEIHDLARLQGVTPLREKEAEQLATLFGGWIAGILLGTRLGPVRILRSRRDVYTPTSVPDIQIDRQNLFAYLVNVVFSRDLELYTFLKDTAVLQQMTPALCNAVLESTDAADRLHYLDQQGLFVTRSGDAFQFTYTCHPVLRELLFDELRCQSPERFVSLHRRAMEFWQAAQDYEQAIYHAFEAKLYGLAAGLILEVHEPLFAQGRVEVLSRWIDALPSEATARYPALLLIRAKIYLLLSEHTHALPLLTIASESLIQQPWLVDADELPLLQASISIAQGEALFQIGEYGHAQKFCQQVIEQIPADEIALHAEAHTLLGVCANVLGDYTAGIAHLQKALQLWGRNSERRQTATLHNILARTYGLLGNFPLAEHHLSRAAKCWDRLQDGWGKVNNLLNMGMIKQRQGEFASAEVCFREALKIARGPIHFRRGEAYTLVNLSELYQEQGLYEQSLAVTEDGLALARQLQDRYLTNCTLGTLAMTYLFMGDAETALFLVSEVKLTSTSGGYERANCELTRGTILLYQRKYAEAYSCLVELESYLRTIGLQWELLCTTLRLVECLLMRGGRPEALRRIDDMATLILRNDYEQTVRRELRLLPALACAIKTMPELAHLHAILQSEMETEEEHEEPRPDTSVRTSELIITSEARLKILALGEPAILIDEEPVTRWRRPRAMELFFLLLDSGRPLRKEQIITALWPETDEHINQTLHSTIHYLRKSLGEACIASRGSTYWLELASLYRDEVWYDVAAFRQHDAGAKEALASNDDVTARTELIAMVDLYRGDYVQPFYSDWCTFQRDKLRLAYIDARQQLALIAWRSEQFDESAVQWQHILAVDNCLEEAHYGLMRCYVRQGKRGLALRQYQRCAEVLQRELAVEPGTAMQNLLQHLMKTPSGTVNLRTETKSVGERNARRTLESNQRLGI